MSRFYRDWLTAYVEWASFTEAPRRLHFWSGVSAIAGALRRRVWIEQDAFQWLANHFIIFVAPPGVVSKSTTISLASGILRRVPSVKFGPDAVTAAALAKGFAESLEDFQIGDVYYPQCALTLTSSELGNLIDPHDRVMLDFLTDLWDGRQADFTKVTKTSGSDRIVNPWINIIACTTPAWLAANFPEYVIGGGFTSRCIFVYADKKEKLVAYPTLVAPTDFHSTRDKLVSDLEHISIQLAGPVQLTPEAYAWGTEWYRELHEGSKFKMSDDRMVHWLSREQAHLHKLAIVISASCRDDLLITPHELQVASEMLRDIEGDIPVVFENIGRSAESNNAARFLKFIRARGVVPMPEAIRYIQSYFPQLRDFEGMLLTLVKAGQVRTEVRGQNLCLVACELKGQYTPPDL